MNIPENIKLEVLKKIVFGDLAGARELLNNYSKKGGDDNVCTHE